LLIEKGIKPDDIVKNINQNDIQINDFSSDSEDEEEFTFKEPHSSILKSSNNKSIEDSDTDSDKDLNVISKLLEEENVTSESIDTIQKLKQFMEKNNKILLNQDKNQTLITPTKRTDKFHNDSNKIQNFSPGNSYNQGQAFLNKKRKNENNSSH
jgi:hypothetical protein